MSVAVATSRSDASVLDLYKVPKSDIALFVLSVSDFVSDLLVSCQFINGVKCGSACSKNLAPEGITLLIFSTIGFISSILATFYGVIFTSSKKIPWRKFGFSAIPVIFEDFVSIVITLYVLENHIMNANLLWIISFGISIIVYFITGLKWFYNISYKLSKMSDKEINESQECWYIVCCPCMSIFVFNWIILVIVAALYVALLWVGSNTQVAVMHDNKCVDIVQNDRNTVEFNYSGSVYDFVIKIETEECDIRNNIIDNDDCDFEVRMEGCSIFDDGYESLYYYGQFGDCFNYCNNSDISICVNSCQFVTNFF